MPVYSVDKSFPILCNPWTVAHQTPLSMGFSRQEYWSGLPFSSPGDLSDPGTEPASFASPSLAGRFFTTEPPANVRYIRYYTSILQNHGLEILVLDFPGDTVDKNPPANGGDTGSILGPGRVTCLEATKHMHNY